MRILVTGGAGFIGSHVVERLLRDGQAVDVLDNFDPFYARAIKEANLAAALARYGAVQSDGPTVQPSDRVATPTAVAQPGSAPRPAHGHREPGDGPQALAASRSPLSDHQSPCTLRVHHGDLRDRAFLAELPGEYGAIIHLAAKAGVRPSINDPVEYQQVNVEGTQNLLEFARARRIRQFVFGSSSSVYGVSPDVPWREDQAVLQPISPYASSKVSGELLGHVYAHLFGIRFLALRFFTVYGPRQRPDLAIHKFSRHILAGELIPVYGDGSTRRDYTYVGDIVAGVIAALHYDASDYEVINLGNNHTVSLAELIAALETAVGRPAVIKRLEEQPGDVRQTWADVSKAKRLLGYDPRTTLEEGLAAFVDWLRRE